MIGLQFYVKKAPARKTGAFLFPVNKEAAKSSLLRLCHACKIRSYFTSVIFPLFVKRLWRTVKYEEVYLKDYSGVRDAKDSIQTYFDFYNNERPHQSLGYKTPSEVYYGDKGKHTGLTGVRGLISGSVPITNSVLLQEAVQGDPSGHTLEIIHLKRPLILS